jgi:hypothetical protein
MTQDELSKLISEFLPYPSEGQHYALRQFAMLVAEAEREACAKICDEFCYGSTKILVEKAIRARGQA